MRMTTLILICLTMISCGKGNVASSHKGEDFEETIKPVLTFEMDDLRIITPRGELNLKTKSFNNKTGVLEFDNLSDEQALEILQEESIETEYRVRDIGLFPGLKLLGIKLKTGVLGAEIDSEGQHDSKKIVTKDLINFVANKIEIRIEEVEFETENGEILVVKYPKLSGCRFGLYETEIEKECRNHRVIIRNKLFKSIPEFNDYSVSINYQIIEVQHFAREPREPREPRERRVKVNRVTSGTYREITGLKYVETSGNINEYFSVIDDEALTNEYRVLNRAKVMQVEKIEKSKLENTTVGLIQTNANMNGAMNVVVSNGKVPNSYNQSYNEDYKLITEQILLAY